MAEEDISVAADLVQIPEGAIPTSAVVVMSYINPEGEEQFGLRLMGEDSYSKITGLMAMASHDLWHQANPTPCEDVDD